MSGRVSSSQLRKNALAFLLLALALTGARDAAALTRAQLDAVAAPPTADAFVPLDLVLKRPGGAETPLGAALGGRPTLLMLADYRCTQLCGSILGIAARALAQTGLRPGADFNLLIVGFNPEAQPADAAAMRREQIALYPDLEAEARFLEGEREAVERLENSVGFTAIRDQAAGRFAHPADLYVLTPQGRVSAVLNGLSLDPSELRLALAQAGESRVGWVVDRFRLICYGLDPQSGTHNALAMTMLRCGVFILFGTAFFLALALHRARAGRRW
ncbi:SCO family protein [Rhodoblastus sp.]|uniref:SCO family protein n=1 Tax=Rhodoblastus sp. TaxID=1962975 RepID=UPI003F9C90EF